jgi:hypothetical protein
MSRRTTLARVVPRLAALLLVLALGFVAAGCGHEEEPRTVAETEGLYIELDELLYQVQLSRVLNPANAEDEAYLVGLPEGTEPPERGEVWFAIFMRVQNVSDEEKIPADTFRIVDSDENEYTPLLLDPETNPFAYESQGIPAGSLIPIPDSIAANGPTQGSLLLFKVNVESLQNRPLELKIEPSRLDVEGTVNLDV